MKYFNWIVFIVLVIFSLCFASWANAEMVMVLEYNPATNIALTKNKCERAVGYVAVAARVDNQYMKGCWTPQDDKHVKIQWNLTAEKDDPNGFSIFEISRFYPLDVDMSKYK